MRFPRPHLWGERPPPDERVDRPEVEAPRGALEPTGTNGPTPHQPPQPPTGGTTTPGQPPPARRPATGPPDQPGGRRNHYTNHDQPTPHPTHHTAGQHGGRHNLVVVTAPGKRPATYRTWKLSPAAPMVLHPRGCGRVGNRHNTPPGGGPRTQARPPHTHPRAQPHEHTHTRNHAGTRAHTHTGTHARNDAKNTATPPRNNARNTAHPHATQPHKTSFPAHGG